MTRELDDFVPEIKMLAKLVHEYGRGARHRVVLVEERGQGGEYRWEGEWALYTSPAVLRHQGKVYVTFTDFYGSIGELSSHGVYALVDPGLPYESVDESDPREDKCRANMVI